MHDDRTLEEEQGEQQNASPPFNIQLEKINCNSVDIDLNSLEKSHWAYRAINEVLSHEESTIVLNDNDLREFVKSAKGSYGIYRGYMGGSTRHFLMFLSFTHPKPERKLAIEGIMNYSNKHRFVLDLFRSYDRTIFVFLLL